MTTYADNKKVDPFALRDPADVAREIASDIHVYGDNVVCETDTRGYATPKNLTPTEIVVHAPDGFITLWEPDTTLKWRFNPQSMAVFANPEAAKAAIRELLGKALVAWGDAAPVRFSENEDAWDFEIVMRENDRCNPNGCVLASAFFPDPGRHQLVIYPKLFTQSAEEQVDTMVHEIGHTFGLRHFFAKLREGSVPSEIFGTHKPLSIMNYGHDSELTDYDRSDLTRLYQAVWSGALRNINGTPVRFVKPFHASGRVVANPAIAAIVDPRLQFVAPSSS